MAAAASGSPDKGQKSAALRLSSSMYTPASAAACSSRAFGLPALYSGGCAAPNTGVDRYAVTGRSVYLCSLSAFAFCMRRVNAPLLSLRTAPKSRATRAASCGPQSAVQSSASATDTERREPSPATESASRCLRGAQEFSRFARGELPRALEQGLPSCQRASWANKMRE